MGAVDGIRRDRATLFDPDLVVQSVALGFDDCRVIELKVSEPQKLGLELDELSLDGCRIRCHFVA